jgi:hypothetical protein
MKALPYLEKAAQDGNNLDALIQVATLMEDKDALACLKMAETKGTLWFPPRLALLPHSLG